MILGTIQTVTANEGVTILVDGETTPTTKKYAWLAPYSPKVGDRVLIEEISGSYVILGAVVTVSESTDIATMAKRVRQYSNNPTGQNYVEFTYFNSNLWVRINGDTQFALARG
jgi:hypothetical protein